jgi:sec-independent protein translocase protein TatA
MIGGLGFQEIIVILLILLLLFGGKKLPELAKGLGKGIKEFKSAASDISSEVKKASEVEEKKDEEKKSDS